MLLVREVGWFGLRWRQHKREDKGHVERSVRGEIIRTKGRIQYGEMMESDMLSMILGLMAKGFGQIVTCLGPSVVAIISRALIHLRLHLPTFPVHHLCLGSCFLFWAHVDYLLVFILASAHSAMDNHILSFLMTNSWDSYCYFFFLWTQPRKLLIQTTFLQW